jgi:hypothetical protein
MPKALCGAWGLLRVLDADSGAHDQNFLADHIKFKQAR